MSGFDLVPLDGGAPVHLPPGETVLGRGPLLGVSDKRVSRLHGLLQNLSGRLQIKPMHMNPCFVQSSLTDDPRPLRRGSWFPLQDGDVLSLLPGQFIYQVLAVGAGEHTPRNSQTFEEEEKEEEERPTSPEPDVEPARPIRLDRGQTPPHEEPTLAALSNEEEEEKEEEEQEEKEEEEEKEQEDFTLPKEEEDDGRAVSVMKKRVLPAWMTAAVAPISSSSPKVQSSVKRSKTPKLTTPTVTHSSEEAGLSEEGEEHPRKRRRKDDVTVRHHGSSSSETSSESHSLAKEEGEEGEGGETSRAINTAAMTQEPDVTESKKEDKKSKEEQQGTKPSTSVSARLRPPCPYGKDCYRKNPVHFQETSHPGDSDFEEEEEEEEEEEADRPDPSVPTAQAATGRILFTGKNTNTQREQLDHKPGRAQSKTKMKTSTRTASSMTTARTWARTPTTSLRTRRTAARRTWTERSSGVPEEEEVEPSFLQCSSLCHYSAVRLNVTSRCTRGGSVTDSM